MATRLSEAQAAATIALTEQFKQVENREAAKWAALVALYFSQRVDTEDPNSVDEWLELMVPRLIQASDQSAVRAARYFEQVRRVELPLAERFTAQPATGYIDEGVRASLLTVGPATYREKARDIRTLEVSPAQERALLAEAKKIATSKVAGATLRHAQAGGRQTIHNEAKRDEVALGWVRVTRAKPCFFCAMLASRGLHYRPYSADSFLDSDARFTGDGDAKVHDNCGCSLKPVFSDGDPLVARTDQFAEMWSDWSSGGVREFRRKYEHWVSTGEYL